MREQLNYRRWGNLLAVQWLVTVAIPLLACGSLSPRAERSRSGSVVVLDERFDHTNDIRREWAAVFPESTGAAVVMDDSAARLELSGSGEVRLRRMIEADALRARRVRLTARMRVDSASATSQIVVAFGDSAATYRDHVQATVSSTEWAVVDEVFIVEQHVRQAEIALVMRGKRKAWFDDVKIEVLDLTSHMSDVGRLTAQQLDHVEALTRAIALVRHRHPSDQAANLDWDAFFPTAIDGVLRAPDRRALMAELHRLFKPIAPTVAFTESQSHVADSGVQGRAHLVRWQHFGLGSGGVYVRWREGQGPDKADARAYVFAVLPNLAHCKKGRLVATGRRNGGDGSVAAHVEVGLGGSATKRFSQRFAPTETAVALDIDMPPEPYNLKLGIRVSGRVEATIEALSFECDGQRVDVDMQRASWLTDGIASSYSFSTVSCETKSCLTISRTPLDTEFVAERDLLAVEILPRLWIHVPLAVWSDGTHTLPSASGLPLTGAAPASELARRLSTIASAWGTVSLFYPFFEHMRIDWSRQLRPALSEASTGRSISDVYLALARLLAKMHDNHARPTHPAQPIDGVLPVALRWIDGKLIVTGALKEHAPGISVGSQVLAIDDKPTQQAYAAMHERVSSATAGWSALMVPYWLTLGPRGTFSRIRTRDPRGAEAETLIPHLPRDIYDSLVRESRPAFGAMLAPQVYYVDFESMKAEAWQAIVPALSTARAVIIDMRAYPGNAVFSALGHFSDKESRSPEWHIPMLEAGTYHRSHWTIRPMLPRIKAKVFVLLDGRAGSAAETVLQIIRDNRLATLVGETSAGTNGNVEVIDLPGGFAMRFTGMRVPLADGTLIHGRGIEPDVVVHPTLDGIRAGRDEILEAAVALASTSP